MNTETPTPLSTPARLRLIAEIIERGLQFEIFDIYDEAWLVPNLPVMSYVGENIAIRIKVEPRLVPLEPKDCPVGSVLQPSTLGATYYQPTCVSSAGVCLVDESRFTRTWAQLKAEGWRIKRPGEEWTNCEKPAP